MPAYFDHTLSHDVHGKLIRLKKQKKIPKSHIINSLLTKLFQPRWLDIGLIPFLFCEFMDLNSISVHVKKRTWPISSNLTACFVNNPYVIPHCPAKRMFFFRIICPLLTCLLLFACSVKMVGYRPLLYLCVYGPGLRLGP